jgi:hypothetical protein
MSTSTGAPLMRLAQKIKTLKAKAQKSLNSLLGLNSEAQKVHFQAEYKRKRNCFPP